MSGWGRRSAARGSAGRSQPGSKPSPAIASSRSALNEVLQATQVVNASTSKLGSPSDTARSRRVAQTQVQRGQDAINRLDAALRILRSGEEGAGDAAAAKLIRDGDEAKRAFASARIAYRERLRCVPVPATDASREPVSSADSSGRAGGRQAQAQAHAQRQAISTRMSEAVNLEVALAEERAEATREVVASAIELRDMAQDLGELVDVQGEQIDEMAENVDTAEQAVKQGNSNMEDAIWYQQSNRNLMLILCCVGLIILGVIVGPVVWAVTRKK